MLFRNSFRARNFLIWNVSKTEEANILKEEDGTPKWEAIIDILAPGRQNKGAVLTTIIPGINDQFSQKAQAKGVKLLGLKTLGLKNSIIVDEDEPEETFPAVEMNRKTSELNQLHLKSSQQNTISFCFKRFLLIAW